tara:strand:- start:981 stop:1178 length:198 start_codon:yes stop_codon:yes gene_type:complete
MITVSTPLERPLSLEGVPLVCASVVSPNAFAGVGALVVADADADDEMKAVAVVDTIRVDVRPPFG